MAERLSPQAAAKQCEPMADGQPTCGQPMNLAALVALHHAAVYRYARRLCGCPTEAEDLTQQAFLIARRKLEQLRDPERACAWLLAIVRSCFLKSVRKVRPIPMANLELAADQVAASTPTVDEIDREQLDAALAELPDDFRVVLSMFYFEDLSYQQIAEALEIPVGTVMSRLSRAKGHLRKRLASPEEQPKASPARPVAIGSPAASVEVQKTSGPGLVPANGIQ